jgi:hypothetical protein
VKLYHFTTEEGAHGISDTGVIETNLHHVLGEHFAWFTAEPTPTSASLGLKRRRIGRSILTGDRMARRIEVDVPHAEPWTSVRTAFTPQILAMLEEAPGANPDIWWVSRVPVTIPVSRSEAEES